MDLNHQTKCKHYHTDLDVIAIKFACCHKYYACFACHLELADHPAQKWSSIHFTKKAILCGLCGETQNIREYLSSGSQCIRCEALFNSNCKQHWALYFEET